MKVYRLLISRSVLAPCVPMLQWLDSKVLRIIHRRSSKSGIRMLRAAKCNDAKRILAAMEGAKPDSRIEHERARLLRVKEPLAVTGLFDEGMSVSVACALSKSPLQAALLAAIARVFAPSHAIELGTNVGISSAYIGSAILGTLVTLEASASRQVWAQEVHDNLGIANVEYVPGLFEDTLDGVLEKLPSVASHKKLYVRSVVQSVSLGSEERDESGEYGSRNR